LESRAFPAIRTLTGTDRERPENSVSRLGVEQLEIAYFLSSR
jgi:hypothetical protein